MKGCHIYLAFHDVGKYKVDTTFVFTTQDFNDFYDQSWKIMI